MNEWTETAKALPPEGDLVETKFHDAEGCRNVQGLRRKDTLATDGGETMTDDDDEDYVDCYDPERDCPTCRGSGRVTTEDYESYLGAMYKPCPECGGDPCIGQPPLM